MRASAIPGPLRNRFLAVVLAAGVALAPAAPSAEAATPKEKKLVKLVNNYRAEKGKAKLKRSPKLTKLARKHSKAMKANGDGWFHSTAGQLTSYMKEANCKGSIGENVTAMPGTVADAHGAFVQSSSHRKIMLKGYWKKMGAGVVKDAAGWLWVTELFCY